MSFKPKSEFLAIMIERGFLHQCSDLEGLDALAAKEKRSPMSAMTARPPRSISAI